MEISLFKKQFVSFQKWPGIRYMSQRNEVVKGTSGATHLLIRHDKSRLERWKLCVQKNSCIVIESESSTNFRLTGASIKKYHEDTLAFQKRFLPNVMKVLPGII